LPVMARVCGPGRQAGGLTDVDLRLCEFQVRARWMGAQWARREDPGGVPGEAGGAASVCGASQCHVVAFNGAGRPGLPARIAGPAVGCALPGFGGSIWTAVRRLRAWGREALSCRQDAGPIVAAVAAMRREGGLRRAVYHDVADAEDKNLRESVRRIDGVDAVRTRGAFCDAMMSGPSFLLGDGGRRNPSEIGGGDGAGGATSQLWQMEKGGWGHQ
jgi:hypothetical protein